MRVIASLCHALTWSDLLAINGVGNNRKRTAFAYLIKKLLVSHWALF